MTGRAFRDSLTRWPTALFTLERHPFNVRLAVRGTVGLMVPLLLGQLLAWPAFDVIAFPAFLLAFGDSTADGGGWRRLVTGSIFAAVAVASGVLVGVHPVSATVGMFLLGGAIGLAGVYGDGAAAMALPVAWMFLELGLTSPRHTPFEAARLAVLVLAGGAWAVALAGATRAIRPDRPLAAATGHCFVMLADYLDGALDLDGARDAGLRTPLVVAPSVPGYGRSPETRVRAAIAEARFLAVEMRRRQTSMSPVEQRLIVLIELADQIFSSGALLAEMRESGEDAPGAHEPGGVRDSRAPDVRAVVVSASRAIARALTGRGDVAALSTIEADLGRLVADAPSTRREAARGSRLSASPGGDRGSRLSASRDDRREIDARLAVALTHALHLARGHTGEGDAIERLGDPLALSLPGAPAGRPRGSLRRALQPLRDALDTQSVVGRHALRYALVTAAAVAIDSWRGAPFGYWIPLTVTVVLKPYAGTTLTRAGQRVGGTVAGATVGVLLLLALTPTLARVAVVSAAFFASLAVMPLNYGLVVFFLSIGLVPFEAILGKAGGAIGLLRVVDTCIGGALALAGGYALWPSFERKSLPALLSAALLSTASYADGVLARWAGAASSPDAIETVHRQAGLANTNLQASFERVASEPGKHRGRLDAILLAVTMLQRLLLGLNALARLGPEAPAAPPAAPQFRELVARGLGDLPAALASRSTPAPLPDLALAARGLARHLRACGTPYDQLVAHEVERLAWQVEALRTAVGRIGADGTAA